MLSDELPPSYVTLSDQLRDLTHQIINQTIHRQQSSPFMNNNGMIQFAKQICKELKRPYIPYGNTWIDIPKKKYLNALHAPLKLVAKPLDRGWTPNYNEAHVQFSENTVYTSYRFYTDEGLDLFRQWLARTKVDPEMRMALRLPSQVTG